VDVAQVNEGAIAASSPFAVAAAEVVVVVGIRVGVVAGQDLTEPMWKLHQHPTLNPKQDQKQNLTESWCSQQEQVKKTLFEVLKGDLGSCRTEGVSLSLGLRFRFIYEV